MVTHVETHRAGPPKAATEAPHLSATLPCLCTPGLCTITYPQSVGQ